MKKTLISEMSWYEFRDAMSSNDLIIIPVGSIEEHGLHNPLGTDLIIARNAAKAIGERVNAPVAPAMPVGNARNLIGFPGTATIDVELLREVMIGLCSDYIKHGAKKFLFINGHGGNTATLKIVSADLYAKYGVISTNTEWWTILPKISKYKCNDHGGKFETSMVMAVDEKLVNKEKAETVPRKNLSEELTFEDGLKFRGASLPITVTLDKLTAVGNYGAKAEEADPQMGRDMFQIYVNFCAELAEELRKIPI